MTTNHDTGSRATAVTNKLERAIAGMTNSWPEAQTTLVLLSVSYTPVQFVAKLQQVAAPFLAVIAARMALESALSARNAALADAEALVDAFYTVLPQHLPAGSADVASFGSKPKKARQPLTVEQKQAAAAKRAATRAARHIMGKNQRLAIQAPAPPPAATTPPAPTVPAALAKNVA